MAGRQHGDIGGINSLGRLIGEHRGALNRDLIDAGTSLAKLGSEALTWADLLDFVNYAPLDSALAGEFAGFPPGVRFGDVIATQTVNEVRMLAAGLAGERHPKLIDILHSPTQKNMRLKHTPNRLTVAEMKQRIGWD
jgi:hypothetical protein